MICGTRSPRRRSATVSVIATSTARGAMPIWPATVSGTRSTAWPRHSATAGRRDVAPQTVVVAEQRTGSGEPTENICGQAARPARRSRRMASGTTAASVYATDAMAPLRAFGGKDVEAGKRHAETCCHAEAESGKASDPADKEEAAKITIDSDPARADFGYPAPCVSEQGPSRTQYEHGSGAQSRRGVGRSLQGTGPVWPRQGRRAGLSDAEPGHDRPRKEIVRQSPSPSSLIDFRNFRNFRTLRIAERAECILVSCGLWLTLRVFRERHRHVRSGQPPKRPRRLLDP